MKNIKFFFSLSLGALALLAASSASAVEWIFDHENYSAATWSTSFGSAGNEADKGCWYKMEGENKVYIQGGSIAATDTISVGSLTQTGRVTLTLDQDVTIAGLTIASKKDNWGDVTSFYGSSPTVRLTVNGDVNRPSGVANTSFNKMAITINGGIN